jgi:hypothetical protein
MAGTAWRLDESGAWATRTPQWATVIAILLVPCTAFLSLLLLLAKERYINGYVVVEVAAQGGAYSSRIYVSDFAGMRAARDGVSRAQALSIAAGQAS